MSVRKDCLEDPFGFPEETEILVTAGEPLLRKCKKPAKVNPGYFAMKLHTQFGLIYFSKNREWFEWDETEWKPVSKATLQKRVCDYLRDQVWNYSNTLNAARLMGEDPISPPHDLIDMKTINGIINMAKYECNGGDVPPPLDPDVIPVQNGLLLWKEEKKDFEFRAYTKDDLIFSKLNVKYDPQADQSFFLEKLAEIIPDSDNRRVLQEYLGAATFPENRTRKFIVLQGEGGCGKSVIVRLFSDIMTLDRTFDLDFRSLNGNYAFSGLTTQTLLTASEAISEVFCRTDGIEFVKKAVGGDYFATRQKYRNESCSHYGYYSLILITNNKMRFKFDGRGDEFKDRMILIRFDKHIEKRDLVIKDKLLRDHRSAIFGWILEGAKRVRMNNWNITLTPEQISCRDRLIESARGIDLFVKNYIEESDGDDVTSQEAYETYIRIHRKAGFENLSDTVFFKRFALAMSDHFDATRSNTIPGPDGKLVRGYRGYRLVKNPIACEEKTLP